MENIVIPHSAWRRRRRSGKQIKKPNASWRTVSTPGPNAIHHNEATTTKKWIIKIKTIIACRPEIYCLFVYSLFPSMWHDLKKKNISYAYYASLIDSRAPNAKMVCGSVRMKNKRFEDIIGSMHARCALIISAWMCAHYIGVCDAQNTTRRCQLINNNIFNIVACRISTTAAYI